MSTDDPFGEIFQKRNYGIKAHDRMRQSEAWAAQQGRLSKTMLHFGQAVHLAALYSTRVPAPMGDSLLFARADDLLESAVAITSMASYGLVNPARREMRFLLEACMKFLTTDQAMPRAPLRKRIGHFEREVQRASKGLAGSLSFSVIEHRSANLLREKLPGLYDHHSTFVHASAPRVRERLKAATRGEYVGFEDVDGLRAATDEVREFLDICLVFVFEALGPGLTGDLFIQAFDHVTDWSFADSQYCNEVSAGFDHRLERQNRDAAGQASPEGWGES